jgi:hypothetical protein
LSAPAPNAAAVESPISPVGKFEDAAAEEAFEDCDD